MGVFITFEGIDGCGKSTQIKLLDRKLKEKGVRTLVTREPGGTEAGWRIRELLINTEVCLDKYTQLFLFMADRIQHLEEIIRPSLLDGIWVLCDRFVDSTLAYQGYGLGVKLEFIENLHREIVKDTWPDITVVVDCPVSVARKRLELRERGVPGCSSDGEHDRYEGASAQFQERLREGYLEIVKRFPERAFLVDGSRDIGTVHIDIINALKKKKLWPSET